MSLRRVVVYASALFLVARMASIAIGQDAAQWPTTPIVPRKSLPSPPRVVVRSFKANGVKKVVLRAGDAEQAVVKSAPGTRWITISGRPEGDAQGYHPIDPNWRETPAWEWGLDFKAKSFGPVLVISTENEISYIHHYYHLGGLVISVPEGVEIIKEPRKLTGEGPPDLSLPAGR
jgi:hypothetical protein